MNNANTEPYQKKILTIPNLLSLFRLCLIPVMIWLYCVKRDSLGTTLVLLLSGATDVADGLIARRFHMVSDFGKAFDPVADKLTQISMLVCLITRFPYMLIPLLCLTVKEIASASLHLLVIRKTGVVPAAVWHGKATTVLLYATMILHLVWGQIPAPLSYCLIAVCTAMILLSGVLYTLRSCRALGEAARTKETPAP